MSSKVLIILLLVNLFFAGVIFAETVILKTGEVVEGRVVNRTGSSITLLDRAGAVLKYHKDEIAKVVSDVSETEAATGEGGDQDEESTCVSCKAKESSADLEAEITERVKKNLRENQRKSAEMIIKTLERLRKEAEAEKSN